MYILLIMSSSTFNGKIKFYSGPMFGGKSNALMNDYIRNSLANKKCLLIRYKADNRYENHITHNKNYTVSSDKVIYKNIVLNDYVCNYLMDADNIVDEYDIIFIDEIQFFQDHYIFCEKWANQGKDIVLAGLISTYERKLFSGMEKLLPLIENIIINPAVCIDNGNDAYFTTRTIDNNSETLIGADDIYKAVDRKTYYNNENIKITNYVNMIIEFNDLYNKLNNTHNELDIDKVKQYINDNKYNFNFMQCINNCSM